MKEINFEIKVPKIRGFRLSTKWRMRLKVILSLSVVVGAFAAGRNFDFTFAGTLILIYFGISVIWDISSRIAAAFLLFFVAACPVLLMLGDDVSVETAALYAYYFLAITIISEALALKKKG